MPSLNLNYVGSTSLGYGRLGVMLHKYLSHIGVNVYNGMISPDKRDQKNQLDDDTHPLGPRTYGTAKHVCWVSTPSHTQGWWKGQVPSIFTMFEAMRLPESFREGLHNFQTVVVPSKHNVELFSQYHPNVKYVPLGVDPEDWHYIPREKPETNFNFLCAGSGLRKGTDLAYKAFQKVFPEGSWKDGPIPHLIMKNPRNESFYGDRVMTIAGKISREEEIDVYSSAHCYLQPSRGEGFGMQPLQAMAQGIPTILTAAHGHDSFAHLGYGISSTPSPSGYFLFGHSGEWWEPSLDELCEQMEYVYNNYDQALEKAKESAEIVSREFVWEKVAREFTKAIELDDEDFTPSGEWIQPTHQLFLLRVSRPWKADIAGTSYFFKPGQDYWEPADILRILFEGGVLDESCITDNPGLLPEQIARLDEYRAENAFCPTCSQQINTGIQKSDVLSR